MADLGNDCAEQQLSDLLSARKPPPVIVGTGRCLHCEAVFSADDGLLQVKRWCDSDCRDDYLKRNPEPAFRGVKREAFAVSSGHVNTQLLRNGHRTAGRLGPVFVSSVVDAPMHPQDLKDLGFGN